MDGNRGLKAFLHTQTYYSLMAGAASPEKVCAWAREAGYEVLSVCDRNALYGLPETLDAAHEQGLKLVAAASIAPDGIARCTAYCLTRQGYRRLCELLSRVLEREIALGRIKTPEQAFDGFEGFDGLEGQYGQAYDAPRVGVRPEDARIAEYDPVEDFRVNGWDGLALAAHDARTLATLKRSETGGELYLACDGGHNGANVAGLAAAYGVPLLATQRALFFGPGDRDRYRLLAAVDRRLTLDALGRSSWADPGARAYALDAASLTVRYGAFPEAIANANELAFRAPDAGMFFHDPPEMPRWEDGPGESFALLRSMCESALPGRFPAERRAQARDRLVRELAIIGGKGFADYFLVVRDIVSRCPRTCGRGSAASSIVSYLLGLTHVDPLRHDLFFERFLNEGRSDPPDIDIDFPWDERRDVLAYVFERYKGRSGMVADHCTFARRSALRESALALGIAESAVSRYETLERRGDSDALPDELRALAASLRDVPRYIGSHPGGVVIVPDSIFAYTHLQSSPAGFPLIAWEKDGTERAGLVKIDLLGNRSLAVLRDCIELANVARAAEGGPELSWDSFDPADDPVDGPVARALIETGDTIGIFYVESPATRQLIKRMGVADYDHLVVASSIIRPAANKCIDEYVRRLHGGTRRLYSPAVEAALSDTHGIMVYQEDVSRVAIAAAGFDAVDADRLRKTLSKKRGARAIEEYRERFMQGCARRGENGRDAAELWEMMLSFCGYSFCKAHSASYALVSYRLAWMKALRPAEFIASVLNNGGGFYSRQTYLDEARRLGIGALPPHVGWSRAECVVEREGNRRSIRLGLAFIAELSGRRVQAILEARESRPFAGLEDFLGRTRPSRADFSSLVRSGALDGYAWEAGGPELIRPAMMWAYHAWKAAPPSTGGLLFSGFAPPACIVDYSDAHKLVDERDTLGVIVSRPLASLFLPRAREIAGARGWPELSDSRSLGGMGGKRVSFAGVSMAGKEVIDRTRRPMCFLSLSDQFGSVETVFFPKAYEAAMPILETNGALLVSGVVHEEQGALTVHVEEAVGLNRVRERAS